MSESPVNPGRAEPLDLDDLPSNADHALCVYAEPLVRGRRGLVVAPSNAGIGERLLALGARSVHLFDPVPYRAETQASTRGLTVRPLDDRALDFREGAFDFAIVLELGDVGSPPSFLAQLRKILDRSGTVLARTLGSVEYAELFDLVSLEFPHVVMIGEVPFGGVAFAELGAESPEVTVDSQLVSNAAPRAYLALAANEPRALDGYAVVQLPPEAAQSRPPAPLPPERPAVSAMPIVPAVPVELLDRLEKAETRAFEGQILVERLTGEIFALREELDREGEKGMRQAMELEVVHKALEDAARAAEYRIADAMQASQEASVALQARLAADLEGQLQAAQADLASRLAETEAQLLVQDAQVVRLSKDLIDAKKRLEMPRVDPKVAEDLAARLGQSEKRVAKLVTVEAELGQLAAEHVAEVSSLEAQLLDRGRMLKAQEVELGRRAAMVEDLLSALEDAQEGSAVALPERPAMDDARLIEMKRRLDEMALEIARREGELEARAWRIEELELERQVLQSSLASSEAKLSTQTPSTNGAPSEGPATIVDETVDEKRVDARIEKLEAELFALRQAFVQEHEARVEAEARAAKSDSRV